jgi:biopolymer transport protein ExbD
VRFKRRERRRVAPDLTPMIDVTFQLILFFMVTTEFIQSKDQAQEGIQVDLPRAHADALAAQEEDVSIWVSREGSLFLGEAPVDVGALQARLRAAAAVSTTTLIVIRADAGVPHGRVVEVMDLARAEGLTRLAIATEPGVLPAPSVVGEDRAR